MTAEPGNAIVLQAGFFYIGNSSNEHFPTVHSRPVLRCIGGTGGQVVINGQPYELKRGSVVFMPWKARLTYRTGPRQAMVLCSCHIVPDFRPDSDEFDYAVAYRQEELAQFDGVMQDVPLRELEGIRTSYLARGDPLAHLTNYIASRYDQGRPEEWQARRLAGLLIAELRGHFSEAGRRQELSQLLQRALDFIDERFMEPISTRDIARHLDCSTSTVTRHFRRELRQTPVECIHRKRISRACRLLATSTRHVGQIAGMVGVQDRYYFSKLFRQYRAMTPTEYRQRNIIF